MTDWAFTEHTSCLPCLHGNHDLCRHNPQGPRFSSRGSQANLPCECERHEHPVLDTCYIFSQDDWTSRRCGRPVKGVTRSNWVGGGRRASQPEVPACGIHIAAYRRVLENDQRWKEQRRLERERSDANRAASEASKMWAERLWNEFGFATEAIYSQDGKIRVKLSPEPFYEQISKIRDLLDEVYTEHPLKKSSK